MTLFILVIIHELGHVTAAWSYGWQIHSIELLPFGGVTKMDGWDFSSVKEEVVVALAGPFHHIWMILISYIFYQLGIWNQTWTEYFIQGNLILAGFNLLPIYPLDGGRVFQAVTSCWFPYRRSILFTYCLSLCFSFLLLIIAFLIPGVWVYLPLFIISCFLILSNVMALKKKSYYFIRFLIQRFERGASASLPIYKISVAAEERLPAVIKRWYRQRYHVFEVVDDQGKILGWLTEDDVLNFYFQHQWKMMKELV